MSAAAVELLARQLSLGDLLQAVRHIAGSFELVWHHTQGEFHHDVAVRVPDTARLPRVIVVATNCNGGVKEVLAFDDVPAPDALWHHRCPDNPEFTPMAKLPTLLARETTIHFFDPCELLRDDARSELLPEHRARQAGGGWCMADPASKK